jgi:hypothetical protein
MNWRRGLIRLWLVVSVVWALIAAGASIDLFRQVSAPIFLHDGEQQLSFPGNTPLPMVRRAVLSYLREKSFDPSTAKLGEPSAPNLRPVTDPKVLDQLNTAQANVIIGDYQPRSYLPAVEKSAGVVLLPPIFLLVLGAAALWTISGFKSDPSAQKHNADAGG